MTQQDSSQQATETETPPPTAVRTRQRDLSLAGVILLLSVALTAGVTCSVVYHVIIGATASGWHWKTDNQSTIDLSPADDADQPRAYTFKRVDLKELDDSLHMMSATEAMFKMDYGRALAEIQKISPERLKTDSGCTTLQVECLLSLKQSEKVVQIANDTLKTKPLDYAGWLWRAEAYEQLKEYDKAIADYKKSLSMFPNTRKALGTSMSRELIDRVEQAIGGLVYRRMGASYERSGDFKQAALCYEQDIRLSMPQLSSTLSPQHDKAALVSAQRSVDELTNAIASRSEDGGLYLMRAKAYKALGQYKSALADYDHVKKADTPNLCFDRAGVYFLLGDFKNAAKDLRKVHAEDPLYEMPHMRQKKYSLAVMPMTLMKKSAVLSRLDKMVQENPNDGDNYLHRGTLQMAFREYDEGASDLQQYLAMKGDSKTVAVSKARIYLALCRGLSKRKNEYDVLINKALESCDSKWWCSIMQYLVDRDVTEAMLLNAVKDNPSRAVQAHYYIGQRLAVKGLRAKADEHFKQGIEIGALVDEYYLCKLALLPNNKEGMQME